MANGIQVLPPVNPNRFAGLQQGALNFVSGLNQQFQNRQQLSDNEALIQFIQARQQGLTPQVPQFQTAGGAGNFANLLGQQTQQPFTLPAGAQRFDPQGNVIAQAPAAGPSPSQQIAQQKLNVIRQIQAIPESQRTAGQRETLKRLIEGQAAVQINFPKPAAASERTAIAETNASLDALSNLEDLFESPETETGPVVGRISPVSGLVGLTTDEQENLMAATAAFKNKVIKDITGAQMSEQEAKRIMKQIPDITDPPERWKAKKKQTEINLRAIQRRRIQVLQQSGIVAPAEGAPLGQGEPLPGQNAGGQGVPMTATNPQTGERIQSFDGGKTWQPIQ